MEQEHTFEDREKQLHNRMLREYFGSVEGLTRGI